jgi:hypothetical protein
VVAKRKILPLLGTEPLTSVLEVEKKRYWDGVRKKRKENGTLQLYNIT